MLGLSSRPLLLCLRRTTFWKSFSPKLIEKIDQYASHTPCPLTVEKISEFCNLSDLGASYEFLRLEIPSRLAGMIKEMGNLPDDMMSIRTIRNLGYLYCSTLEGILEFEHIKDHSDKNLKHFYQALSNTLERHQNVPYTLANGMMEYKQRYGPLNSHKTEVIQTFMDRFLLTRISLRMIMQQHVQAYSRIVDREKAMNSLPYIELNCPLKEVALDAYANAKAVCEHSYAYDAAPLKLEEYNTIDPDQSVTITYPRTHLHLIAFELIKNALRAVIEYSENICAERLGVANCNQPLDSDTSARLSDLTEEEIKQRPIIVRLVKSHEDITMCVNDMGGGIPYSVSKYMFQYLYTTATVNLLNDSSSAHTGITPMAGFGCGLPISRMYARYFTGDLKIASVEGRGTDAYVYLKALPAEARENLPVYSAITRKIYRGQNLAAQWTGKP